MEITTVFCVTKSKFSIEILDGNKKVKGIKRHIVVDKNGFLLAIMVTVANVHDSKAVFLLIKKPMHQVQLLLLLWMVLKVYIMKK